MNLRLDLSAMLRALACAASIALCANAAAQGTSGSTAPNPTPSVTNMPMPHGIVPSKSELPMSAFSKLDSENKGYISPDDVVQLQGFDNAFKQADQNRDGRLNASEFNSAWSVYSGQNP